ncbi:SulP family sulfate permease [Ereboglobus sp. PH5-5]|uniref:SulP family inorganic anion transporter n=1 Tax=Ereboglobus sp. PH5-5 TaxID=2940529 RepID=UPI0024074A8D|nr:SulP family inorganic anion transporter [Ereboglobus sp. PH5-5]MDF9832492.1 SulP family sulfate permease [Ereboglobus sp. PH5-5]
MPDAPDTLLEATQAYGAKVFKLRLPFVGELRKYSLAKFKRDLIAGATLTLVSIPQAIGFALILGLPPGPVITSVVIGGFVGSLFFTSRYHVFGPTSSISLITAATITTVIAANPGLELSAIQLAVLMAFMIGVIQFLAGLFQFGEVTRFISLAVVVAYGTGIGLLLMSSQLHHLFGLPSARGGTFGANIWGVVKGIAQGHASWIPLAVGLATWLVFEILSRLKPKWPEALFGLVIMGFAGWIFSRAMIIVPFALISGEGALAAQLPAFAGLHISAAEVSVMPSLFGTCVAIAILGMLEATSITKNLAAKSGQSVEPRQELAGMGAANIACALFSGVPGSSSFARSATNYQSGAATQLASMFSSVIVIVIVLFITPAFGYIPVAALAAHLIRVGLKMINPSQIRIAFRSTRADAIVFALTLLSCLFLQLDTAIYIGIGVSLALFLRKASAPSLVEYTFTEEGALTQLEEGEKRRNDAISIVHVEGELFFGAADLFQEQVRLMSADSNIRVVILRMKNARHLDATSVMSLLQLHEYLQKTHRHLIVSGINPDVEDVLVSSGAIKEIGRENVFPAEANLTASTKKALLRASHLLQTTSPDLRLFYDKRREQLKAAGTPNAPANGSSPTSDYSI